MLLHAATSATRDVWHYKGYNLLKEKRKGRLVLVPANKRLDYSAVVMSNIWLAVHVQCRSSLVCMSLNAECKFIPSIQHHSHLWYLRKKEISCTEYPLLDKGE